MTIVNLDGVAPAQGDGGAAGAFEEVEAAADAGGTKGVAFGQGEGADLPRPDIDARELAGNGVGDAGEDLEGGGGLEGADDGGDGVEHAGGFAGGLGAGGRLGVETAQAGRLGGEDGHDEPVGADGGAVNPGDGFAEGEVVEEEAGFEIIGGVEDAGDIAEEFPGGGGGKISDDGLDGDFGVDEGEAAGGGDGFREGVAGIGFVKEPLALEVVEFDVVAVDDAEEADTGARQRLGMDGA